MSKKLILILGIVILSAILAGCSNGSNEYVTFNPYQGYEGLRISFLDNAPPYEVSESETIPIGILIENKGAFDVTRGRLSLSYEKDYMTQPQGESYDIRLRGKSFDIQEGEFETKLFYSKSKPLDRLSRVHDVQVIATACYEYQTTISENICIDTDYFNIMQERKPCKRTDIYPGNQGAPLSVSSISQILQEDPNNVTFEIVVENVAGGETFDYFSVDKICSSGAYLKDKYNQVRITGSISASELSCEEHIVKLNSDGVGKFRCGYMKIPGTESQVFNTVLNLKLFYGYISTTSTEIHIEGNE